MSNTSYDKMTSSMGSIMEAYKKMQEKKNESKAIAKELDKVVDELVKDKKKLKEDHDEEYSKWMSDVKSAHPGKDLKFKGRMEGGTHTVSAEVPGEDRSYGMWDHNENKGHIFTESHCPHEGECDCPGKLKENTIEKVEEALDPNATGIISTYNIRNKRFDTKAFVSPDECNKFLETPEGSFYGYIGTAADGVHHVAKMDDEGYAD